jgi:SapC protein
VTQIAIVNSEAHKTLRVKAGPSARYGDAQRFIPVVINEFPPLAVHYPILASKDADTGAFYCGAMLGFDTGENLFLEEGKAPETYRPLNLQRGPFYTAGSDLAIDLDSPRIDAAGEGQALFSEAGEPTPYLQSVIEVIRQLQRGVEQSKVFIETLVQLKLITAINIGVSFDDGTKRDLTGLYTIDQEALRTLPDAAVLDLFRRGYLYLIYLMTASLKQLPLLVNRKNRRILQGTEGLGGGLGGT